VAINASHLVLAANEEQTIYPIMLNEGGDGEYNERKRITAFPTTHLGGTIPSLRQLSHGPPYFIGCLEDVVINGNWVSIRSADFRSRALVDASLCEGFA